MKKIYKKILSNLGLLFVVFVGFFSIYPLFQGGLPPTHDGEYHIVRFYEFNKTLMDGNWYPRWATDLNFMYGSPLFNYVYPLPNYIASIFHFFGLSFIDTFKVNLIFATIIGSISSFIYMKQRYGVWSGVVTSVFYTYAPYHFLDIYIRGSVGEVWALAFFPFALLAIDSIQKKPNVRNIFLGAIVYALIIFSHNILAVMFTFFAFFYCLLALYNAKNRLVLAFSLFCSLILAFLLSSVFILPALLEQKYVVGLQIFQTTKNFADLYQLLIPSWGSGFSGGSMFSQMSFQIGVANILVFFIIIFCFIFKKIKKEKLFIIFFMIWLLFSCFLITPYSAFLWENISFMDNFQFPWRTLSIGILCGSILAGCIPTIFRSKIVYIALIIVCIGFSHSYAHPPYFLTRIDSDLYTKPNFIYGTNSIGNSFQTRWLPQQNKLFTSRANVPIDIVFESTTKRKYKVNLKNERDIVFNISYFPGWFAQVDGKNVKIKENNGKVEIYMPKGEHEVTLVFSDTYTRKVANAISITVVCVIFIFFMSSVVQYLRKRK